MGLTRPTPNHKPGPNTNPVTQNKDRGDHLPPTPTRQKRPRWAKGPASAPDNRAGHPDRDPGPAKWHHSLQRPRGTSAATSSPRATSIAVSRHPSPAARPGTTTRINPCRTGTTFHAGPESGARQAPSARHRRARPLPPDAPMKQRPPASSMTTTPQRSRLLQATHPMRRTGPHQNIMCTTGTPTTTTSPVHRSHRRRGTTHSRHTLTTSTKQSSTTCRPHCTGSQRSGHHAPA